MGSAKKVPVGWNATKYPGEWVKDLPQGICIVREGSDGSPCVVRCYTGSGGEPEDISCDTVEECFDAGDRFLNKLQERV